jgi:sugar lactone lactonase YvrE
MNYKTILFVISFLFLLNCGKFNNSASQQLTKEVSTPTLNPIDVITLSNDAFLYAEPNAITVDDNGIIWIVDRQNHRIVGFDESGAFVTEIGGLGSEKGKFNAPTDIVSDRFFIYVVDSENYRVQKFDIDTYKFVSAIDISSSLTADSIEKGKLKAIGIDNVGSIYLTDSETGYIFILDAFNRVDRVVGGYGKERGKFLYPNSITVDNNRVIYISDSEKEEIQAFSNLGNFLYRIEIENPIGLATDSDNLIALGGDIPQIKLFSWEGEKLTSYPLPFDAALDIYVDNSTKRLFILGEKGIHLFDF